MAVNPTRLLLLGAVAMFEPVNGYQIRRELASWRVDQWAHTQPGSIYHGLAALAGGGSLRRHDLVDNGREVAVYELTSQGRDELEESMVRALEDVDLHDRVAFQVAFAMIPLLGRHQVVRSLWARQESLRKILEDYPTAERAKGQYGPPHALRGLQLWYDSSAAELRWLEQTIGDIVEGRLRFGAEEDWGWEPKADDPGHQMTADQARYRELLGR